MPTEQLVTWEHAIRQHRECNGPYQQVFGPLQQGNHHLSADSGIGLLKRLQELWNGLSVADNVVHQDK